MVTATAGERSSTVTGPSAELAELRKIDLVSNFSTMDLQRNVELEFDAERARFVNVAPWCDLVKRLGFEHSQQMPLVHNDHGSGIYRMVFFSRHDFPNGIWGDVARDPHQTLDVFAH